MQKIKVFISSVQKEFAKERESLYLHFSKNPLLSNFFEPVIFEELPAASTHPGKVYLDEIENAQLYLVLLGTEYGYEDTNGVSPTELEFRHAKALNKDSFAFIKGGRSLKRDEKENAFIKKIQNTLSYKRFEVIEQLIIEVDKACFSLLKHKGLVQLKNFDETILPNTTMSDINQEKLDTFIGIARAKRGFPLRVGTPFKKVLTHLNMIENGMLTNSALLAFGLHPQKFFTSAIVKCAHFHTLYVAKPIPDHKVISGDVFEQIDQAVDFVLSKISMSVGLRDTSNQAPLYYEIPRPVVAEAIVNAVAHRDYNSNGSVQVMLFPDRLEISNPGYLTPELNLEKLKTDHASYPPNQLLAEPLYQAGYIERYGTGTGEIFRLTAEAGLKEPVFSLEEGFKLTLWRLGIAGQVTGQVEEGVKRVVWVINNEMKRSAIQELLGLRHRETFLENYLNPSIESGFVEMTLPDKPRSPKQRYRLTKKGETFRKTLESISEK